MDGGMWKQEISKIFGCQKLIRELGYNTWLIKKYWLGEDKTEWIVWSFSFSFPHPAKDRMKKKFPASPDARWQNQETLSITATSHSTLRKWRATQWEKYKRRMKEMDGWKEYSVLEPDGFEGEWRNAYVREERFLFYTDIILYGGGRYLGAAWKERKKETIIIEKKGRERIQSGGD